MLVLGCGWVSVKNQRLSGVAGRAGVAAVRIEESHSGTEGRDGRQRFPLQPGPEAITSATLAFPALPAPQLFCGALLGKKGGLTGELLLELPDQSCCLLLLLGLLKPLALELR